MGRAARKKKERKQEDDLQPPAVEAAAPPYNRAILAGVSACFALSGFAALLYQTAWLRQFSIAFGTSEMAIATVLAAYMAGLGGGAAIAGRFINRIRRPVLVYGLLEAGIAASALCVPLLLTAAGWLYAWALGGLPQPPDSGGLAQPLYYLAASFVILALPTGLMGATLPLLTRYAVQSDRQVGPRVAWLYGINTFGAVLGTIAAAFLLLPNLGLKGTVLVGASFNLVVFVIAAWLAKKAGPVADREPLEATPSLSERPTARDGSIIRANLILPLILLSGANSFMYEILWTRLLNHVLGGTVYAFATMLASFLSGIAIGGFLAGRLAYSRGQAARVFAVCQVGIGVLSAAIYFWMQGYVPTQTGLAANAALAAMVLLPATFFIGATFPLVVRILAKSAEDAPSSTAKTYIWNTAGAIIGSILAGFWLIPALGFQGAIRLAVGTNLLIAVASLFLVRGTGLRPLAYAAAAIVAIAAFQPTIPLGLIDSSVVDANRGGRPAHYAVGRSATVLLKQRDGYFYLRTNGLPEAFIEPKGAPPMRHGQKWLTALPVAARPDADSMLIVGFGGGVAIEGVPPSISDIDVIELEPEVIKANQAMADRRRFDPLGDTRVSVVTNDARNSLALTVKLYDIVVSQPSHPWTAGASHLYTDEFVGLVKDHLTENGVFVQWINSMFVDETLLRSLSATLLNHFPNVRIYQPAPSTLLFLASDGDLSIESELVRSGRPLSDSMLHYSKLGINSVEDLLVALTADTTGVARFAAGAPVNSDDDNQMAMFSRSGSDGLSYGELLPLFEELDPLLNAQSWVFNQLGDINFSYVADRLIVGGFQPRAAALSRIVPNESTALTIQGLGLRHEGRLDQSEQAFAAAILGDPDNMQAQYALLWRHLGKLAQGTASEDIIALAEGLRGPAAAVAKGWTLGIRRDWNGLSQLDNALGQSKATDIWYPEAVKLRADWRIQGSDARHAGIEALAMLDQALMVTPLTDLLVIRAGAAIRIGDPHTFVETAQAVQQQIRSKLERSRNGEYLLNSRDLQTMRARVEGFTRQLESPFVQSTKHRAAEVRSNFGEVETMLRTASTKEK